VAQCVKFANATNKCGFFQSEKKCSDPNLNDPMSTYTAPATNPTVETVGTNPTGGPVAPPTSPVTPVGTIGTSMKSDNKTTGADHALVSFFAIMAAGVVATV
jgi:hypothetical protein